MNTLYELEKAALTIRKQLLKLATKETIHIGGDLSVTDLMTTLWQYQMHYDPKDREGEQRDRFVLSKGHSSAVMCFNQAMLGCYETEEIYREYAADLGRFSMHSCNLINPYVEVSTGSLGHGMPIACGIAAALRLKGNTTSRVYTIMGDGEQAEGSVWEAVMNAKRYGLGNLVVMIDHNGLEADGYLRDITGLEPISEKYRAFGWDVYEFDGNDVGQIMWHFDRLPLPNSDTPIVFVCHTVKGKGVSFMENQARWHAGKITEEQYNTCIEELEKAFCEKWRDRS